MRILFWNTQKNKDINHYLLSLVLDYNIDTLVLAEYTAEHRELEDHLKRKGRGLRQCFTEGCDRLHILSNYVDIEPATQDKYYSIQIFQKRLVLCSVHLMSNLHGDHSYERLSKSREIIHEIEETGKSIHSSESIIIGDFNAMPYSPECLSADGFHGLPSFDNRESATRMVYGKEYIKYYNPMWNLFGDFFHPPGTYYFNTAEFITPRWYMLDQVIVSREAIPRFIKENLQIITDCSCGSLMGKNGHPNKRISDHFPILCEMIDES